MYNNKIKKNHDDSKLLDGVLVLDLSQFLSGPFAALRLQDLGARVIKVEKPNVGDLCRQLYISDTDLGGDSTLFHAINRGKQSLTVDFKDPNGIALIKELVKKADVVIQNFRPGVIERLGLDYETLKTLKPDLVYASISGYGAEGGWAHLPGQDLLAQARSGLMWLNGDSEQGPVPFGLAVADLLAGNAVVQGILAALLKAYRTGKGAHIETSLLEALVDFQFEVLTTHFNDGGRLPSRAKVRSAHAYLAAPYGVYRTSDGWLALAMTPLDRVSELMEIPSLMGLEPDAGFKRRDEIKEVISDRFLAYSTSHWLSIFEPKDVWCAEVLDWPSLLQSESFKALDMVQAIGDGNSVLTTKCPIRVNGARATSQNLGPKIGEHNSQIIAEFAPSKARALPAGHVVGGRQ